MSRMFGIRGPLFDKAGDDGKGAGGGEPPPAFTEAQLAIIGQTVNAAITSHTKRQPALAEQLKGLDWKALLSPVVSELIPKPDDGSGGGDGGSGGKAKGGKGAPDDAVARQLSELATKLEASEKRAAAAEQARVDTENQRAIDRATNELRTGLAQKVRPELLDMLVENLAVSKKALKVGENGAALLSVKRAPYKGAPEQDEDVPLAEAIPIFLASDGAKVFLPPPGTAAGGPPPRGGGGPRSAAGSAGAPALSSDPATRTLQQFEALGIDPASLID